MSSIGSLGFNPNRRHRASNLAGSINAVVIRPRIPNQRRSQPPKEVAVIVPRRTSPPGALPPVTQEPTNTSSVSFVLPPPPIQTASTRDETHWVYATVGPDHLRSSNAPDDIVCVKDARVMLMYPMVSDSDTGLVSMKVKRVDECTGQLEWNWVVVYDPNNDTRYVTNFSMIP